jgi:valyl-tRNA synthetase
MPFITEEIWQKLAIHLPESPESIMIASYPTADEEAMDAAAEKEIESVIEIVGAIRNARAEAKVEPAKSIEALIITSNKSLESYVPAISTLARAHPLTIRDEFPGNLSPDQAKVLVLKDAQVVLPLGGIVDRETERKRLKEEIEVSRAKVVQLGIRLQDKQFLSKAPAHVVEKEREKLNQHRDRLERLERQLEELG